MEPVPMSAAISGIPWGVDPSGLGYQYGEDRAKRNSLVNCFTEGPSCRARTNPNLYIGKKLTSGLGVIMYDYGARPENFLRPKMKV